VPRECTLDHAHNCRSAASIWAGAVDALSGYNRVGSRQETAAVALPGTFERSGTTRRMPGRLTFSEHHIGVPDKNVAVGLPSSTVTFLFTDIEGSTALLRRL